MLKQIVPEDPLFDLYAQYVGEPTARKDVYGYWTFLAGSVVGSVGVLVYLLGLALSSGGTLLLREVSITLAAVGLAAALLGIVLLLPVTTQGVRASGVGAGLAALGVIGFVAVYPRYWAVGTPDYSPFVIAVYALGVAGIAGVAALVPVATGEKSLLFAEEYERDGEYPGTLVGRTLQDGLFAVYRRGDEWTWRLLEQDALAGAATGRRSRLETEEEVDRVRANVEDAGLLEIKGAAFRLYETGESRWRWLLMREDGSVMADSGEAFESRGAAADSVNDLKDLGPSADVLDLGDAAIDCYADDAGWRWRLLDDERSPLAEGAEGYDSRDAAEDAVDSLEGVIEGADVLAIEPYGVELVEGDAGWRWRLLDEDRTELATGANAFSSRRAVESAVYDLFDSLATAPILDAGRPAYEAYPDGDRWRWRLVAGDDVVARSHGRASDEAAATESCEYFRDEAADADVVVVEDAEFEYYDAAGGWQWRLVTPDREVLAEGTASFESADDVESHLDAVRTQVEAADLIEFETAAFQLYETDGEWRWRLVDEDGNVMADSGAEHDSREAAAASMATLKQNAPDAELLEIETAAFELFEDGGAWNWRLVDVSGRTTARGPGGFGSKAAARTAMNRVVDNASAAEREVAGAAFQLYAVGEEWRWQFVRPDGTVVADGVEGHATRDEAAAAVDGTVREAAAAGDTYAVESVAVQLYERGDAWAWRLIDRDRSERAAGAATYPSRDEAHRAVGAVREGANETAVFALTGPTVELVRADDGWRWRLVDESWTSLVRSPSPFEDRAAAEASIDRVQSLFPDASVYDYGDAAFELVQTDGEWRWRLLDEDERVVAASAEGRASRADAAAALDSVRDELGDASILEIDTAAFELYEDRGGWRWRLVDENGNVLGESLSTYDDRGGARDAVEFVQDYAPTALTSVAE